ncbi:ATP-binding protein [Nocardia heshunensis]
MRKIPLPDYSSRDRAQQFNLSGDNTGNITLSTMHAAAPRPVVTSALRRDPAAFIGRGGELRSLLEAVGHRRLVSIHTVDGMAGVGKTALVTRAAHVLADQFPDGQYFVELHAHTPGQVPADPIDVLAELLIGLGTDPGGIPDSLSGRRDLWRDRLSGKRVLLILDDARDHAQIEPLLPTGRQCLTLVTSRRRLIALDDALPLTLDILAPDPATELFTTLARRTASAGADRDALTEIVRLCGRLPLAIVLLAGRLAHHPSWTITRLADEFTAATDRLGELDNGDRAVRAAFTMSYRDLPTARQKLFRYLGFHPGLDIESGAVAALADISVVQARRELEELYVDHLVDETTPGRYRLHDLLREYARALTSVDPAGDTDRASQRLLDYYLTTAAAADRHLSSYPRPATHLGATSVTSLAAPATTFGGHAQAVKWMRAERANLLACLEHAAACELPRLPGLTEVLAGLLDQDGPWPLALQLHQRAATVANQLGDTSGEATALDNLGFVHMRLGNYSESTSLHAQALAIYRQVHNRLGEANALNNLGTMRLVVGDSLEATKLHAQALTIYRQIGDRLGEANAFEHLGSVNGRVGDHAEAIDLLGQALALYRETGNRRREADTLDDLGIVHWRIGDHAKSADLHRQAQALYRETGDHRGQADTLFNLGNVRSQTGEYTEAIDLYQQALALYRELGDRVSESRVYTNLGSVLSRTGSHPEATDLLRQALTIFREIGDLRGEAEVLNETGHLMIQTDELKSAIKMFTEALALTNRIDSKFEQARALEGLALCRARLGETDRAVARLHAAIEIYRHLGVPELLAAESYLAALRPEHP